MQERVRICDIAEELGLSTATVSNVIHGKTNKVSDETVQRVTALLEERQYIPSMAGILLARNSSGIIGVFVNDHPKYAGHTLRDGFIASALDALSTEIERGGQFMLVKKARCAGDVVRFASMWNMEGLILIGFCEAEYKKLRENMRISFVVYDGYFEETDRIVNLVIDHYSGGYQAGDTGGDSEQTVPLSGQTGETTLTIEQMPNHVHSSGYSVGFLQGGITGPVLSVESSKSNQNPLSVSSVGGSQPHAHSLSGEVSVNTLPPYYALCFIMKL